MIEFNLLPNVKLEYLKARRLKRVVIAVSFIIVSAAIGLFVLLILFVDVAQKVKLDDLAKSTASAANQLTGNKNLNGILTIQNQLKTLPSLQAKEPVVSNLYGYLTQVTPNNATISTLSIDFTSNTISIQGSADSLNTITQFVDTLQFTTYNNGSTTGKPAFTNVNLGTFSGPSSSSNSSSASYSITFNYDPVLFTTGNNVKLVIPSEITTRSILDQPNALFKSNNSGK